MLPSPTFVTPVMGVLLVGAYLGGLAFFFQARRGPPK
jgi:nitrate reductase NapE component